MKDSGDTLRAAAMVEVHHLENDVQAILLRLRLAEDVAPGDPPGMHLGAVRGIAASAGARLAALRALLEAPLDSEPSLPPSTATD